MKIQFKNVIELAEWCKTNTDTVKRITSDEIRIYHYMITYEYTLIIATIIEKGKI